MRGRRGGLVVYMVVGVLVTIASILFLLHASFRTWNRQMRTDADEILAAHLARGAVEALMFGAQLALSEEIEGVPDPKRGKLNEALLADKAALDALWAVEARATDERAFLKRLVGSKTFDLIDDLARAHPLAKLTFRTSLTVPKPDESGLVDPVPKTVQLGLQAICQLRSARRDATVQLSVEIGSRLPGVLGRFTLAATSMIGNTNQLVVDASGAAVLATVTALYHDAADFSAADATFKLATTTAARGLAVPSFSSIDELEKSFASRGAAYLSAAGQPALALKIAAGDAPLGQNAQVFGVQTNWLPPRKELARQPGGLASLNATQPGTSARQDAWIEGQVTGFFANVERQRTLLEPDATAPADTASWLRPCGTPEHPSPGLMYGDVRAQLAAISNLAVDRDMTGRDEAAQNAAGFDLPRREADDPPFANATAAAFAADLARESRGETPGTLSAFGSLELEAGKVTNRNHTVVQRGVMRAVPSEARWPFLELTPDQYSYKRLLGPYAEYEKYMSRRLEMPYNGLLRFAGKTPDQVHDLLLERAFRKPEPFDAGDRLVRARWTHTDPLHRNLSDDPLFVDSERAASPDTALAGLIELAVRQPRFLDATVVCYGEPLFRASFMKGQELDLGGLQVVLAGAKKTDPRPELKLGDATVSARGGGVLDVAALEVSSLKIAQKTGTFEPVVIKTSRLDLTGPGPFEGTFVVNGTVRVLADKSGSTHALVRGNLILGAGGQITQTRSLAVVFDRAHDPTGPEAHLHYRGAVRAAWDGRRLGGPPDLIGLNPYRTTGGP